MPKLTRVSPNQHVAFKDFMYSVGGNPHKAIEFFAGVAKHENEFSGFHEPLNSIPLSDLHDMALYGYSIYDRGFKRLVDAYLDAENSAQHSHQKDLFLSGRISGLAQALQLLGIDPFDENTFKE